jgi:NADPH:quinone reductase-like Zn-dependent oxidoreductase
MSIQNLPVKIRGLMQIDTQSTTLELLNDLPMPTPNLAGNEHLIKVHTTSPCSGELLWAKNFPSILEGGKSLVPCYDLAGVVVTAPVNSPFQPGTEVWTRTTAWHTGNAREYTIAMTEELAKKPKQLGWEDAASVPLSGFTAYQALFDNGGLTTGWKDAKAKAQNAGKRVVITAASGGVGIIAVQLAKAAGVGEIVAVCGPKNVEFVKELGATEVVNYREQSLGAWTDGGAKKADLVIDVLGGQTLVDCWKVVKNGGVLLSINDPMLESMRPDDKKDVRVGFFIMESKGWQLDELAGLIEMGQLKAVVDSVWKLDEYEKAFEIVASGHARGKVVIKVQ